MVVNVKVKFRKSKKAVTLMNAQLIANGHNGCTRKIALFLEEQFVEQALKRQKGQRLILMSGLLIREHHVKVKHIKKKEPAPLNAKNALPNVTPVKDHIHVTCTALGLIGVMVQMPTVLGVRIVECVQQNVLATILVIGVRRKMGTPVPMVLKDSALQIRNVTQPVNLTREDSVKDADRKRVLPMISTPLVMIFNLQSKELHQQLRAENSAIATPTAIISHMETLFFLEIVGLNQ
jgi:hypothetical protein